eukprot:maker-scaffold263_size232787-snap-gene-1.25 protein:Tk11205 transcript:maker-scaffold263_size232787-snap-gene-1.25-mRNA-1 annotation:"ankyrin repeat-containing"
MADLEALKLCHAIIENNFSFLKFLIQVKRANVNGVSSEGTPLNLACKLGKIRILNYLLSLTNPLFEDEEDDSALVPLDINLKDANGDGCLHWLCSSLDKIWLIPRLLEHGANVNMENNQGHTPLMMCAKSGFDLGTKILLKDPGIMVAMRDKAGRTALDWAQETRHPVSLELLLARTSCGKVEPSAPFVPHVPVYESSIAKSISLHDIDSKIAEELECPVCLEEMTPPTPIFSCSNAHLFCGRCNILELKTCPKCREDFVQSRPVRNRLAERWAHKLFSLEEVGQGLVGEKIRLDAALRAPWLGGERVHVPHLHVPIELFFDQGLVGVVELRAIHHII